MTFIPILTIAVIFLIVFFIRNSQKQNAISDLEKLKSARPGEENNFISPANRKFQNVNSAGAKITWTFNENATKVQIKGGFMGINSINSTINIESLGFGRFKGDNGQVFIVEGNIIKSGNVILKEISE